MANKPILIVEDDEFLRRIYKAKMDKEGFTTFVAKDGQEGLELLRAQKPSLVLLDLVMPNMDGFTFLEEKHKDPAISNIPVIVLSNLGQETDIEQTKHPDVLAHVVKSDTSLAEMLERIQNVVK